MSQDGKVVLAPPTAPRTDVKTLYIAGPMTGLPEYNYPAFFKAAERLTENGYAVLNPARPQGREGCESWLDYMRASLRDIADCDGIATLTGWSDSKGACVEVEVARGLMLPVAPVIAWIVEVRM